MKNKEIWKDIPEYEKRYQVSNLGRVRVLFRKDAIPNYGLLSLLNSGHGYKGVYLIDKNHKIRNIYVHRLVLFAFDRLPEKDEHAHHINEIRDDNRLENLEWLSRSENIKRGYDSKFKRINTVKRNNWILSDEKKEMIRNDYQWGVYGKGLSNIARKYGISRSKVQQIIKNS